MDRVIATKGKVGRMALDERSLGLSASGFGAMRMVLVSLALLMFSACAGHAEKRVALVIGNSAYEHAGTLANPRNDATDMAAVLKTLGIEVIEGFDLNKQTMDQKVKEFAGALSGAAVGVLFYAGHGLQVNGNNYMVPVDAELTTASALELEMVRLDMVQRIMENETKTNIIFLDACRNNPLARNLARAFGTRDSGLARGLAPAESGLGTLISFSTQPGNVALDGAGRNSPYTGSLVKAIATPNEDVLSVLTDVRNEVLAATEDKQVPWENHALRARFFFNGKPDAAPAAGSVGGETAEQAQAGREWAGVDKTSAVELETFIGRHASSLEATYAKARLAAIERDKQAAKDQERKQPTQLSAKEPPATAQTSQASENLLTMQLKGGKVTIRLRPDLAPHHVERIKTLTRQGFYNGLKFHRVIAGFMAQTGDPKGNGTGGSTLPNVNAEFTPTPFERGTVGAARAGDPNSANSQFFICFKNTPFLNGQYTVWGNVVDGMQYVDQIAKGEPPPVPDKIIKMYLASEAK